MNGTSAVQTADERRTLHVVVRHPDLLVVAPRDVLPEKAMKQPAPWQKHRPSPSRSNRQTVISKVISKTISAIISTSYLTTVISNVISNTWAVAGKKLETKVSQSYLKLWVVAGRKLERELSQRYLKIKPTWLRSRTTCAEMTPTRIVPQPLATHIVQFGDLPFGGQACRSTSVVALRCQLPTP